MSATETEIVAGDPDEAPDQSPAVTTVRVVEVTVYLLLIALAALLGYDNWRSGIGWASDGPKAGLMPFYLCVILAGAALYGLLGQAFAGRGFARPFVSRDQLRRVLQVFVPTLLFCMAMQWLGLYVASLLLIAGFMRFIGRIAWWKCIVTGIVFTLLMFATFEVAFDVLMPKGPLEALFGY